MNPINEAIDRIGNIFEDYKKTNDERLDALNKGNDARARELDQSLQRMEKDIQDAQKARKIEEQKNAILAERLEILEAANDRPGKSVQEKARDEYKSAFMGALRSAFTDQEKVAALKQAAAKAEEVKATAVTIGTAAGGGHAVPEEISRSVVKLMLAMSDVLQNVKMVQVGTSDYKELITINGLGAAWVAETGTRSQQTTPDLRQIAPTWGELYSYLHVTEWSLDDMFFDVEQWLMENTAEQFAKSLDAAIWNGNGSSKPTGLTNTAPVATADSASPIRAAAALQYVPTDSASPQAFGADDVVDLVYSLNRAYRGNAKFGANQTTQGALRKLKSSNGDYYWQPSFQAGQPDRLMGYPVFTFHDMDDPTTANGLYLGFGDWMKAYTLPYRTELRMSRDDNITTPGYVKFFIRRRYGGIVANNDALKLLKLADT